MSDTYRIKLQCENCDSWLILTTVPGSVLHSFECRCGHVTRIRPVPVQQPDRVAELERRVAALEAENSLRQRITQVPPWRKRKSEKLSMAGIYGITDDGCYIVVGDDGVMRKSPPLQGPGPCRAPRCVLMRGHGGAHEFG